jgi:hypothetical protein
VRWKGPTQRHIERVERAKQWRTIWVLFAKECEGCKKTFWLERGFRQYRIVQGGPYGPVMWPSYRCRECGTLAAMV